MFTIKAPGGERVMGRTTFGPVSIEFREGEARVEEISAGLRNYLERSGYEITEEGASEETSDPDEGQADEAYDPAKYSGKEVAEHLSSLEDDEEIQRILDAEAQRDNGLRKEVAAFAEQRQGGDDA